MKVHRNVVNKSKFSQNSADLSHFLQTKHGVALKVRSGVALKVRSGVALKVRSGVAPKVRRLYTSTEVRDFLCHYNAY